MFRIARLFMPLMLLLVPAAQAQAPHPDVRSLLSIRLALEDDLGALLNWSRIEQAHVAASSDPQGWVRLKYAEAAVLLSQGLLDDPASFVKEAEALARKWELHEEYILLQEIKANVSWDAGSEEKRYEGLIKLARDWKLPHLEARYLALQGYVLMAKGDYDQGMQPMLEAMGILQKYPDIHDLDRMNIKSALAQAFASGSDVDRALSLDQEIVVWARRQKLRGILATGKLKRG